MNESMNDYDTVEILEMHGTRTRVFVDDTES